MTKDLNFTATTTPIHVADKTMLTISFDLPGSGILTPEDMKALGLAIGPHLEQWLTSYCRSRNLDPQLPMSLGIFRYDPKTLPKK